MTVDYGRMFTGGVRCLAQQGIKSGGSKELKRLARNSKGWQLPHTFSMGSSKDYWRRFVLPKIDLETGRAEYRGALPKALASFGVSGDAPKAPGDQTLPPIQKERLRGDSGNRYRP